MGVVKIAQLRSMDQRVNTSFHSSCNAGATVLGANPWTIRGSPATAWSAAAADCNTGQRGPCQDAILRSVSHLQRVALIGTLGLGIATPSVGWAKPDRVAPAKKRGKQRRAERRTKDASEGGTKKGGIEFTLGALTAALAVGLVGRGVWEVVRGRRLEEECADFTSTDPACNRELNVSRDPKIAAGLSFGFAVPAALASGFLFAYAVRIRRDYNAFEANQARLQLAPMVGRRSQGVSLRLRF